MVLGAYHQSYKNKIATEEAIKSFRKYHPTNPYFLVSDGGDDFSDLAIKYNCIYYHSPINLGYRHHTDPSGIYGYTSNEVLEWISRFKMGCELTKSDHLIMMEDDVHIMNALEVNENVEFSGMSFPGNKFNPELIEYFSSKYGAIFHNDWYGSGGGSIFKTKTFLDNYDRIYNIFKSEIEYVKKEVDHRFGWVDFFMTVYYYICGKQYTVNPFHTEVTHNPNWETGNYAIIHQYKKFYE